MTKLGSIYESEILIERIENLAAELELAARWQRPYVLLAVYGSELVRSQVEQALRAQLNGLGQETAYVKVKNRKASDIVNCLKQFTNPENTVFFFDGLQWSQAEPTDAYSALNLQREFFIERKVRVIFWLTQSEITALAHGAPDFWTCRNRVIEFVDAPHEEQVQNGVLESVWLETGEYAGSLEDMDAKISFRESLLTELPEGNQSSFTRANLLLTLGVLNWRKGDYSKANEFLLDALKIADQIRDNWLEAECFNAIALVETSLERTDEAIDAYKQAISLAPEQIFAWNNLGNLCAKMGRNDEAIIAFLKAIESNTRDPIAWNGLGNVYCKTGYADDALAAYKRSIQFMPTFAHPWNGLGNVFNDMGRTDEAVKAYNKAIELDGHYVAPWIQLGNLFNRQNKNRDAIKAYQRALFLDGSNSEVWNELGLVYLKTKAYQEAMNAFKKSVDLDKGFGQAYSNLALSYAQQGKYGEALSLYLESIDCFEGDKDKAISWNRLADVYRLIGDYDNAVAAYKMADTLDPKALSSLEAYTIREPNSVIEQKDAAIKESTTEQKNNDVDPQTATKNSLTSDQMDSFSAPDLPDSNAPYWIFSSAQYSEVESSVNMNVEETPKLSLPVHEVQGAKGVAMINPTPVNPHAREGEPIETEKVNSDSMNAHFWNDKGNLLFKRGAYEEAINAYNRSLQLDPSFGWPYSNLALTYLTQGQYAEAILLYQKSIDLLDSDKDRAISWNGLGNVYRCINDYANAVAAYQKAAELDPDTAGMRDGADTFQAGQTPKNSQTWNDLGELFLKTEAYDQAINAFQKAIDLDPQAGWPHSNLATALTWQGKYEEAIPLYEKSIRLLPNDKDKAFVWNRLGNVYRKLNNYDEAIKSYQKAVTLADEGVTLLTRTRFSLLSNVHAEQ